MYTFSWISLLIGLTVLIAGTAIVVFYKQISDHLANGVSSYDRVKLFGIAGIGLGLLIATNLHELLLNFLINIIFPR